MILKLIQKDYAVTIQTVQVESGERGVQQNEENTKNAEKEMQARRTRQKGKVLRCYY